MCQVVRAPLTSWCSHAHARWTLTGYYGLSSVDLSFPGDHVTGIFSFLVFLGVVYYGMYAAGVLWSVREGGGEECHHDNGVAKGLGLVERGRVCMHV